MTRPRPDRVALMIADYQLRSIALLLRHHQYEEAQRLALAASDAAQLALGWIERPTHFDVPDRREN